MTYHPQAQQDHIITNPKYSLYNYIHNLNPIIYLKYL